MPKHKDIQVYKVVFEKDTWTHSEIFLTQTFELLTEEIKGWEQENYHIKNIERLGEPILLEPLQLVKDPKTGYN